MILKSLVKNIRSNIYKTLIIKMEMTGKKELIKNKKFLQDLIKRRYVFFQGFEIYGGCAGLYDFGPVGCAIKNNIEQLWRQFFVLQQDMLEINCTCITPHVVLQHSGHVAKFADVLVKDLKTGQGHRADKVICEVLQNKLEKGKLTEQEKHQIKKTIINIDAYTKQQLYQIIQKYKIRAPDTGNQLSQPQPFNLMFKTQIGPSTNLVGYLRPQTAQGMFVNFNKLLDYNGGRLPFAAAQIGLGFRNQIAPRNALLRVRQFQMAQIQHFVDPKDKSHKKFKNVAHIKLPLYSRQIQQKMAEPQWITIGQAVQKKIVDNQTLGYFLTRIFHFLRDVGLDTDKFVRFRQHLKDQMAHYACDCWDAQALTAAGWVEIVGCADRSAYDLTHHTLGSGTKLIASRRFKQPRPQLQTSIIFDRKVIGKQFKKDSQAIISHLQNAQQQLKAQLKTKFQTDQFITVNANGTDFKLTKDHVAFQQKIVNVMQQKYTPSVIQPSFGLGRIMSCMLEHTFRMRDQKRTYMVLKPRIAPVKVSILPLQNDARFGDIIHELKIKMKKCLLTCKVDDTGQAIGKRYARTDQIGIPFAITVDYTTLQDSTITLRELHTMRQIRVPMGDLQKVMTNLSNEISTWQQVCKEYPEYKTQEKEQKDN